MIKEQSAGAIVYRITEDGHIVYLLLQAAAGKPWGFPKGKLDAGETDEAAARREIAEEAGLAHVTFDDDFRHIVHYHYRRGRALVKKEVIYFITHADSFEVHLSWEHIGYLWVPLHEALALVHYENARELLRKAHRHLETHYGPIAQ
jgi:8-oxo-dGTP pyrophosphatase MutT (NUDIX family)